MTRTLRTLIPPRYNDEWSFSGRGRWQYQKLKTNPQTNQPEPDGPLVDGIVGPGEPRG